MSTGTQWRNRVSPYVAHLVCHQVAAWRELDEETLHALLLARWRAASGGKASDGLTTLEKLRNGDVTRVSRKTGD